MTVTLTTHAQGAHVGLSLIGQVNPVNTRLCVLQSRHRYSDSSSGRTVGVKRTVD